MLHQVGHLLQEGGVVGDAPAHLGGQFLRLLADHLPPPLHVHHDAALLHEGEVILGPLDDDLRRAQGPKAARGAAAAHAGVFEGHDSVAQEGHQPADGTREGHARLVPAHGEGEAQRGDELRP